MCCSPFFHLPATKRATQFYLSEPAPTLRTMQIWHTAAAVFFIFIFMLAALSYIGWRGAGQKRQGFACRPNQEVALPALSTTFSRKKPEWVMLEVLRIKALMDALVA